MTYHASPTSKQAEEAISGIVLQSKDYEKYDFDCRSTEPCAEIVRATLSSGSKVCQNANMTVVYTSNYVSWTAITEVDDSPVTVESLTIDGARLAATRSLAFPVAFEPEEGIYTATGDFHMLISAETRAELENSILEALVFLWQEYVIADASTFTADALALREQLANTFARVDNAV